jgi:hypothetical protein
MTSTVLSETTCEVLTAAVPTNNVIRTLVLTVRWIVQRSVGDV